MKWAKLADWLNFFVKKYLIDVATSSVLKALGLAGGFWTWLVGLAVKLGWKKADKEIQSQARLADRTQSDKEIREEYLNKIEGGASEEELIESGYIRRKGVFKKEKVTSRPFHFISSDGFHMYVGKNNFQNDELTFRFADNGDWWFHAKGFPGSHVIVKSGGKEMPDKTFEEAGRLAAYFSKARNQEKVEIDYVEKKHVKKPGGSKPGFVVYYTNYSMMIDADISGIETVQS